MPLPTTLKSLTELFRTLGAEDPESWARSQIDEGIPQLHRFLFLRQAWDRVVSDDDYDWIDAARQDASRNPDLPFAGIGHSLDRLLAAGVQREDLAELVRGMQARLLFDLCYLMDDPNLPESEVRDVGWALVATDDEGEPTEEMVQGLHESLLEMDPARRELRSKRGG